MAELSLTSLISHMVFVLSAARGAEEECSNFALKQLIINDCEVVRVIKDYYFYFRMLLERMKKNK